MSTNTAELSRLVAAEARRKVRRKAIGKFISDAIKTIPLSLLSGWYWMLAVGVAHAQWIHALPTIGYWWAVLLVLLIPRMR